MLFQISYGKNAWKINFYRNSHPHINFLGINPHRMAYKDVFLLHCIHEMDRHTDSLTEWLTEWHTEHTLRFVISRLWTDGNVIVVVAPLKQRQVAVAPTMGQDMLFNGPCVCTILNTSETTE